MLVFFELVIELFDYLFVALNILDYTDSCGTRGCGCTCQDEATDVRYDLDDDDPPRVVDFDFCVRGFYWVVDDALNLFGCEFDFHGNLLNCFGCKGMHKKKAMRKWCITFFAIDYQSMDILCIIYYIVVEFLDAVAKTGVVFYAPFRECDVVFCGALRVVVGFGDLLG